MVDEELLKPTREHLAMLRYKIATMEVETVEKVKRHPDDREYARELWYQFDLAVQPMRREIEAVVKVIADYYALQTAPTYTFDLGQYPQYPAVKT